jgi:hypothetical protein
MLVTPDEQFALGEKLADPPEHFAVGLPQAQSEQLRLSAMLVSIEIFVLYAPAGQATLPGW